LGFLHPGHPDVVAEVGRRMAAAACTHGGRDLKIQAVIFDYEGRAAFDSESIDT
jgi:hypothetical protein